MPEIPTFEYGTARVRIFPSRRELGDAAASDAARIIRESVRERGRARIIVATGNSQLDLIRALTVVPGVPWDSVEAFHMDEYVRIRSDHPASFRRWIRERVEQKVHPKVVHYIEGDAPHPNTEIERYERLLNTEPIDLAFVGFGENGHIAFNDPHAADFQDPALLKIVALDNACRGQQVGEGHFPTLEAVPREAFTITCPGLFRAEAWVCCVPEARKAQAVRNALEGPISTECPASIVRTHPHATVYLDRESASLLSPKARREPAS